MNKKKIGFLMFSIVIAVISIGYLGMKTLTTGVYQSRSCDWANIDNIESRTMINIPSIADCECSYSEKSDCKLAVFTLDLDTEDILNYVALNGFEPVDKPAPELIAALGNNFKHEPGAKLYRKSGNRPKEESFEMLLDPQTKKLFVSLQYLN